MGYTLKLWAKTNPRVLELAIRLVTARRMTDTFVLILSHSDLAVHSTAHLARILIPTPITNCSISKIRTHIMLAVVILCLSESAVQIGLVY